MAPDSYGPTPLSVRSPVPSFLPSLVLPLILLSTAVYVRAPSAFNDRRRDVPFARAGSVNCADMNGCRFKIIYRDAPSPIVSEYCKVSCNSVHVVRKRRRVLVIERQTCLYATLPSSCRRRAAHSPLAPPQPILLFSERRRRRR